MSTKTDVATGGYYYLPTACETLHTVLVPLLQFSTGRNSPGIISNGTVPLNKYFNTAGEGK